VGGAREKKRCFRGEGIPQLLDLLGGIGKSIRATVQKWDGGDQQPDAGEKQGVRREYPVIKRGGGGKRGKKELRRILKMRGGNNHGVLVNPRKKVGGEQESIVKPMVVRH